MMLSAGVRWLAYRFAGGVVGFPYTQEVHESPCLDGQGMCVRDLVVNECVRARLCGE